jgi:DNA helicase-2/ATP-dependent DNA helicase PcrA
MREHLDGRCRYSDLAVLYRSNAQSRVLEEALIRHRLPYRIYGGLRFFERMEVKDALAYLRLVASREDDGSFERAVNTPARGIGNTTLERLRQIAREAAVPLWKAAHNAGPLLGRSGSKVQQFLELIDGLAAETAGAPLSRVMERVIERSGLREHYLKEKGEQAEARLENLDELVNAARSFERSPDDAGLDPLNAFLAHAALEAGEEQAGAGEDAIQLMTLHSAKGLEFPIVFMVGLENGLFPHQRAVEDGSLEEERRLCYVGITRARQRLYLSHAEVRRIHGTEQIGMPSIFLRDIPPECLVETRPRAGVLRPSYGGGASSYGAREPSARYGGAAAPRASSALSGNVAGGFKLGDRVKHGKFGEGTILSFDGDGDRTRVEIRFRETGTKWLMLSYANLQAL